MKSIELKGELRKATGKRDSNMLRKEEKSPCVLYGGKENVHFSLEKHGLKRLVYTPNVYLVNLDIEGKKHKAILKDLQFHPVTDDIQHIDFLEISDDKPVEISIPVTLNGLPEGVQAGGKLQAINRKLKVSALAKYLPDTLDVDVTDLELGKSIKVGDVSFKNIEMLNVKNTVIASVKLTRAAKGMADEEGEEGEGEEGTEEGAETTEETASKE